VDAIVARGRILWDSIYEPHAVKLHDKLSSYHPDFMGEYMCTLIAAFFVPPPPPLYLFLSLVCSRSLRSNSNAPLSIPHSYAGVSFHVTFPDGREKLYLCFVRTLPLLDHISEGRCGEQAKSFWLFCPGLRVHFGYSRLQHRLRFDLLSRPRSRPTLLRGGTARTQGGHNLVVPTDPITMRLVVPLFRVSNYFSPLHAKRASAFPHLSPLAPLFIHLPLYRSALHRSPGVDRDAIVSLSIDHKSHFWLRLIFRFTDLRSVCFR